jgi:F-box and WD-40 domain protein CDC4
MSSRALAECGKLAENRMTGSLSCGLAATVQLRTQSATSSVSPEILMDVPEITGITADPRAPFASLHPQTHYLAVSPPTPAPSPGPGPNLTSALCHPSVLSLDAFSQWPPDSAIRKQFLAALLSQCSSSELHFISTTLANLLKRDFLHDLPTEIALHILSFVDDHQSLIHAGQVSRHWRSLVCEPRLWKHLCEHYQYQLDGCNLEDSAEDMMPQNSLTPDLKWLEIRQRLARQTDRHDPGLFLPSCPWPDSSLTFSYYKHFKRAYMTST